MSCAKPAALAALRSRVCLQCRSASTLRTLPKPAMRARPFVYQGAVQPAFTSVRWHSAAASGSRVYDFARVKEISDSPSSERLLVDVREPSEYEAGYIPSAINLPIKSQPDAIFLPEEEFEDRFGFEKPPTDSEVVFYCRSGVRSSAAAHLAQQHGYTNVAEYRGSWLDWEKNGGPTQKP